MSFSASYTIGWCETRFFLINFCWINKTFFMDMCQEKMDSPWEVPTHFKTVYEYFWIILPNLVKMRNMLELGKYKLKFSGYSI